MDLVHLIVYLLCFLMRFHGAQGELSISEEEDLEFENQLNALNKPPLKTIMGEAGDVFDCIDIHKQPAFDHPILKNHSFQMAPTSMPEGFSSKSLAANNESNEVLESMDCRHGTVPIRRTRKEDLIRAKSVSHLSSINAQPQSARFPGQHRAMFKLYQPSNPTSIYRGVYGIMNVYNLRVEPGQSTSAQMWAENENGAETDTIQFGWRSNANGKKRGCFNLLCAGFVQVNRKYPVGSAITGNSVYDGPQYEIGFWLFQDKNTGDWWLGNADLTIIYGYWPKSLFPHLTQGANVVAWGGLVKAGPNGISPPMGSGYFEDGKFEHSGYFRNIEIVDGRYNRADINFYKLIPIFDAPNCYTAENVNAFKKSKENGYIIMYGGAGGKCGM
ncbi:hypothetical protein GIB67_002417 [Kingdonia uniflora]|uniref:Neprosin PEP catalytic domain-containing protein n=1 Tax=Kingdonia uniflora TaxID=39325 RepID=A0A7J7MPL5_9MAGN|nr:hypothetical protein GIB67_002417 [Kingdonia uniflora]